MAQSMEQDIKQQTSQIEQVATAIHDGSQPGRNSPKPTVLPIARAELQVR